MFPCSQESSFKTKPQTLFRVNFLDISLKITMQKLNKTSFVWGYGYDYTERNGLYRTEFLRVFKHKEEEYYWHGWHYPWWIAVKQYDLYMYVNLIKRKTKNRTMYRDLTTVPISHIELLPPSPPLLPPFLPPFLPPYILYVCCFHWTLKLFNVGQFEFSFDMTWLQK